MQQAALVAALVVLVLVSCVQCTPYTGDRDFDVPFRKKPLRRGGCSAFGHSCFGGHGKRSDSSLMGPPQLPLFEQRIHHTLPNTDLFKQWLQAYRSSGSLLEGQ